MRMHKLLIPIFAMILLSAIALGAPGVSTFTHPLAAGTISGHSELINISTTVKNVTHCNITFTSTGELTANLSEVKVILNRTNDPGDSAKINGTLDSFGIEDGIYSVGGYCYNSTPHTGSAGGNNVSTITAVAGVKVDNGYPPAATARTPADATVDEDGTVTFSATVTDANTTGCSVIFDGSQGPVPTLVTNKMTYSTTTCTLSDVKIPMSNAGYYWGVKTGDGTTYTDSAYNKLQVKTQGNLPQKALWLEEQGQLDGGNSTIVWIVIILGMLYLFKDKLFKKK